MRAVRTSSILTVTLTLLLAVGCGAERRRSGVSGGGGDQGGGGDPAEGEGEGPAEGEGEGPAEGEGEGEDPGLGDREDADAYVAEDDVEQTVAPGDEAVTVSVPSGRASVRIPPGAVRTPLGFSIHSRPLSDFSDFDDVVNGVYDFGPEGVTFMQRVRIWLPLNDLPVSAGSQLELVYWAGDRWEVDDEVLIELEEGRASAAVAHFTPYGLRWVGGWPGSEGEGEGEPPTEGEGEGPAEGEGEGEGPAEGEGEGPPERIGECNRSCLRSSGDAVCCKGCGDCGEVPMAARCQPECPDGSSWDCEMVCCSSRDSFGCAGTDIGECPRACMTQDGAVCCSDCDDCAAPDSPLPPSPPSEIRHCRPNCYGSGLYWDCERECCAQEFEDGRCVGPAG